MLSPTKMVMARKREQKVMAGRVRKTMTTTVMAVVVAVIAMIATTATTVTATTARIAKQSAKLSAGVR